MKRFWNTFKIIILYLISYIPLISLVLIYLFSDKIKLDTFTLIIVSLGFIIRNIGLNIVTDLTINILLEENSSRDSSSEDIQDK